MPVSSKAMQFLMLISVAAFVGCASVPPYRTTAKFDAEGPKLQTIGFYPLIYIADGKNERSFGKSFTAALLDSAAFLTYRQPLRIIGPDSLVNLLELNGVAVTFEKRGVLGDNDTTPFPCYRSPARADLVAISRDVDAVMVCRLEAYHEVSAAMQGFQTAVGGALFGIFGAAMAQSNSEARMRFYLFRADTGDTLWEYWPNSSTETFTDARKGFLTDFTKGFRQNFPLSREYQVK